MAYTKMPDNPLFLFTAVTEEDDTTYDPPIMLLRCGGAGDLVVKNLYGATVTITGVLAGEYVPGPITAILETSTVSNLTAYFNE